MAAEQVQPDQDDDTAANWKTRSKDHIVRAKDDDTAANWKTRSKDHIVRAKAHVRSLSQRAASVETARRKLIVAAANALEVPKQEKQHRAKLRQEISELDRWSVSMKDMCKELNKKMQEVEREANAKSLQLQVCRNRTTLRNERPLEDRVSDAVGAALEAQANTLNGAIADAEALSKEGKARFDALDAERNRIRDFVKKARAATEPPEVCSKDMIKGTHTIIQACWRSCAEADKLIARWNFECQAAADIVQTTFGEHISQLRHALNSLQQQSGAVGKAISSAERYLFNEQRCAVNSPVPVAEEHLADLEAAREALVRLRDAKKTLQDEIHRKQHCLAIDESCRDVRYWKLKAVSGNHYSGNAKAFNSRSTVDACMEAATPRTASTHSGDSQGQSVTSPLDLSQPLEQEFSVAVDSPSKHDSQEESVCLVEDGIHPAHEATHEEYELFVDEAY